MSNFVKHRCQNAWLDLTDDKIILHKVMWRVCNIGDSVKNYITDEVNVIILK